MINLIPEEAESVVKREYVFRVGGTISLLLGAVFLVLTIALIPTYVLIGAQITTSVRQAEESGLSEEFARADSEVKTARNLLRQFTGDVPAVFGSTAIEEIRAAAPSGISFRFFRIEEEKGVLKKVHVQGTASSREALASFRAAVEQSDLFAAAEVPIADLARDVNLPFTMTVTLRTDK